MNNAMNEQQLSDEQILSMESYTTTEAAERLNVSINTVKAYIERGMFYMNDQNVPAAFKMKEYPYQWRIMTEAFDNYVRSQQDNRIVQTVDSELTERVYVRMKEEEDAPEKD